MLEKIPGKASFSSRIYMIVSLVWGKLEPVSILHMFRLPVLKGCMYSVLYFSKCMQFASVDSAYSLFYSYFYLTFKYAVI